MPPYDRKKPAPASATKDPPARIVTTGGVEVIVKPEPPPEPAREVAREQRGPRAIVLPEGQSPEERRAFLNALCKKHEKLVEDLLERRKDVIEESRRDLRQRVLMILFEHVQREEAVPADMQGFLKEVVRKEVKNHKSRWRVPVQQGADAEAVAAPAPDEPEETAIEGDERETLERYLDEIEEEEAEVVRCHDLFEMTIDETAEAVRRAPSTVFDQLAAGRKNLRRIGREARQAAEARAAGEVPPARRPDKK